MRRSFLVSFTAAFLVAGPFLAGCLTDPDEGDARAPAGSLPEAPYPPGCAAQAPVAAHAGGAAAVDASAVVRPVGCFHRIGTASYEPSIGVGPDGAVYAYPASALGLPGTVQMARSTDEGATWDILTPNVAGVPTHPYSQDPLLYLDPATGRIFAEDLLLVPPPCGMMSITDDGGATWTHTQSGCAVLDHVSIFAGPPATSQTLGYPNVVYRCAISGGALAGASTMVQCQRSLDGGLTWLPPGAPPWVFAPGATKGAVPGACDGGNGHGAVGPDGTVYLPRGHCGQPELAISTDEALTWTTVQVSDRGNACDAFLCEHDAGVGVDAAGHLYYAWVAGDRMPYVVRSADGGATWGDPFMIGPPDLNEAALIQMHVGGTGKLAFAYYGTTTSPGEPWASAGYAQTTWGAYMAVAYDAHTDDPRFFTAVLNETGDPMIRGACGPLRCGAAFDFIDVRIGPDGTPWAPFVDGCFEECRAGDAVQDGSELATGRLWGMASLWDDEDPDGPYAGTG